MASEESFEVGQQFSDKDDAVLSVKTYSSSRREWLAKQKAVAHIYGDWDESYNELPRWVLGVQLTMPGAVAVLRTSPVRVRGQVDDSQAYFHRLFLTFPPLVEAFRHCKKLGLNPGNRQNIITFVQKILKCLPKNKLGTDLSVGVKLWELICVLIFLRD